MSQSTYLSITEDQFADGYKPIANHLNPNASFDWGEGFGTLFEIYGNELAFVRSQPSDKIWTLLTCCDDGDIIASGFHWVNRVGYFITEVPVPPDKHIEVSLESIDDDSID